MDMQLSNKLDLYFVLYYGTSVVHRSMFLVCHNSGLQATAKMMKQPATATATTAE
jgi:hypothetical protein